MALFLCVLKMSSLGRDNNSNEYHICSLMTTLNKPCEKITIIYSWLQHWSLLVLPAPNLYRLPIKQLMEFWHLQYAFESAIAHSPVIWEIYETELKHFNSLAMRQYCQHFGDNIFNCSHRYLYFNYGVSETQSLVPSWHYVIIDFYNGDKPLFN